MKPLRPTQPNAKRSDESTAESPGQLRQVRELAKILSQHDLSELEFENAGIRVRLRRSDEKPLGLGLAPPAVVATPLPIAAVSHGGNTVQLTPAPAKEGGESAGPALAPAPAAQASFITSPFVGTFYRAPSPDAAIFIDVGQRFKKGQVLCIVEAMKLMNEIEAEVDGTILEVLVENGQPVEYGEPLFRVG
jgi:acetyl-CoA carboxylase biotin carboxyl carrier protein